MGLAFDIAVIGGGPAGSTLAARLVQLGHSVCLYERLAFPRPHLGESLSPGVLPLLAATGASTAIAAANFPRVRAVHVNWDQGPQERRDPTAQGLLVDRGQFDQLLLQHAQSLGVHVFQPAVPKKIRRMEAGWVIELDGRRVECRFLADASGRSRALPARRRRVGLPTVALYAYWRGGNLPRQPRIEAGANEWFWGVPLPDGSYNTLIFTDPVAARPPMKDRFGELIRNSGLLAGCEDAHMVTQVRATDATPYLDENCVTAWSIKVGDAALAIDPLSSSGVQKAIQSSLAGAVVVNTLLRKSHAHAAAFQFYRDSLASASERHRAWAAAHYASVAAKRPGKFWQDRASAAQPPSSLENASQIRRSADAPLVVSERVEFIDVPCLEGDFVSVKAAVRHPNLEQPIAFLGGRELAPLLRTAPAGLTPRQLARVWSQRVPLESGLAIATWLQTHGLLVAQGDPL